MECNFILFLQKEMMAISNFCCCCFENVHCSKFQCVKSVQIRSFLLVRIQFEYGKVRARKNSVFRHFSRSVLYTCKSLSGNNAMYDVDYFINLDLGQRFFFKVIWFGYLYGYHKKPMQVLGNFYGKLL